MPDLLVEMGWQSAWVTPSQADRLQHAGLVKPNGPTLQLPDNVNPDDVWELLGEGA